MTPLRSSATEIAGAALLLGVLGDVLFHGAGLGLNLPAWTAMAALGWVIARGGWLHCAAAERVALVSLVGFTGAVVFRASGTLRALDLLAALVALALVPLFARGEEPGRFARLTLADLFGSAGDLVGRWVLGLLPVLARARRERAASGPLDSAFALGRGVLLAAPALFVFGALFAAADSGFERLATRFLSFDPAALVGHALLIGAVAWSGAAALAPVLELGALHPCAHPVVHSTPRGARLGGIEIATVLGSLNLLFAGFVVLQLGYIFGGAAFVRTAAGLTLAEYARRGFFELVTAGGLALVVLLTLAAHQREEAPGVTRLFRLLAGSLIALVLVMLGSAVHRMALYQREFGLTETRLYASAFMAGLAVTLLWFSATVLRGAAQRFVPGALLAWGVGLAMLGVLNPERVIVRVNVARLEEGRPLDVEYLTNLSADAVPELTRLLPGLTAAERATAMTALQSRWAPSPSLDVRGWSLARARAERAVHGLDAATE